MPPGPEPHRYDAFISYSRRDAGLARSLEEALERYRPPRGLGLPKRHLRVFRDETDFTGTEYAESLERNLAASSKLLLLCSPASRDSPYVDGEIEIFARLRGGAGIVTALVDGVPNNEVADGVAAPRAFPDRLVELLPVPLAADYRGFDPASDRVDRGRFRASWHKLLADLYQDFGVTRAQIEQREERRRRRRRVIVASVTGAVMAALATLAGWAWIERGKAILNRNLAVARQMAARAELLIAEAPERPEHGILLALEALDRESSADADRVLRKAVAVVPPVVWVGRHEGAVWAATFLPGGEALLSAGEDGTVRRWETASGRETARFDHDGPVRALAISADGGRLGTGGADGRVRLFEIEGGAELWAAELGRPILRLGFAADGGELIVTSREEAPRHLGLPLVVHRLDVATGRGESFEWPDGVGLDAGGSLLLSFDGLFEPGSPTPVAAIEGLGDHYGEVVRAAALSADGRLLAAGTRDNDPYAERGSGSLRIYTVGAARERLRKSYTAGINALALSSGSDLVLTAGEDGTVRVTETATGDEIWRLSHPGEARAVAWRPRGGTFATAGDDGEVRLYRLRDPDASWRAATRPMSLLALSSDGARLAAVSVDDHPARLTSWDVGGERLADVPLDPEDQYMEPRPLAFVAGGEMLRLAGTTGGIELREVATGRLVERDFEEGRPVVLVAVSPDGRYTATGSWDQSVWVSGASTWRTELSHRPSALEFTPDSSRLLAGSEDGRIEELASDGGDPITSFTLPARVTALAVDPSGRRLAAAGEDRAVRLFDLEDGEAVAVIPVGGVAAALAFVGGGAELRLARPASDGETLVETHPIEAEALVRLACSRLTRDLPAVDWREMFGEEPYRGPCRGLPRPPAGSARSVRTDP